jgi:hypothetical protein
MSGELNMQSKYFTFYKIFDKYEISIGIRIRNLVCNLRYYKHLKKLDVTYYKLHWPIEMDVLSMWKQIDWRT